MKKTYNLRYEPGKYILEYSMPDNKEGKLIIDEKKMELDSVKFYKLLFESVDEKIDITICNKVVEGIDSSIMKKGERVSETLQSLCDEICKEINKKCFSE